MTARVVIQDGNPIWLSPSIIPSRDLSATTMAGPTFAAPTVNSTDIFVYVKVENAGTVDLGVCACTNLGRWADAVPFAGALGAATGSDQNPNGMQSIQFDATQGDKLIIGASSSFPLSIAPIPIPHHRAWGWSPDGRFLAYAVSGGQIMGTGVGATSDWKLSVFALQAFTRTDGTTVAPGSAVVSTQSGAIWSWTQSNFRWVGSSAVLASGPGDPEKPPASANWQMEWHLLCPSAPVAAPNVWSVTSPAPTIPTGPGGPLGALDKWVYLVSPCESVIAFAPNLSAQATAHFVVVSLAQAQPTAFTQNNVSKPVPAIATQPKITTNQHTANGVTIDIGDGNMAHFMTVDDPDCTAVSQTVQVAVDRVKASTLPSGNLGVIAVGQASAGPLRMGMFQWVQVPNLNGWANQGEEHWCFLAQAFTLDGTTIPRPWNGQGAMPPAFPVSDDNCAQRNIMIS